MIELLKEIKVVEINEYNRAVKKFGKTNHSPHESYAVILEEYEEASDNFEQFIFKLHDYWEGVKANKSNVDVLKDMQDIALKSAAEWCQVAAMCYKAKVSEKPKGE